MSEPKVEQWRLPDENMKPLIKQWRELYPYVEHATMDDFIILARTIARETIDAYAARQPDSGEPKENYMLDIGTARRALFVEGTHNWNGWVRDITAEVEVTGEFVDAKKVLQGLGKKLRDVAMRNQLASDLQGAFMSEPPETPAEEATCPMCAKPVFETVETPAGDEQAREVATKLVYSVSKWAGRSPEFMQMMVAKWEDRISAHVAHVTAQLRQELEAEKAARTQEQADHDLYVSHSNELVGKYIQDAEAAEAALAQAGEQALRGMADMPQPVGMFPTTWTMFQGLLRERADALAAQPATGQEGE